MLRTCWSFTPKALCNEIDWKLLPAECFIFSHLSLNTYSFYFLTLCEFYLSVAAGMIYDAKATCRWKIPYVLMGSCNCELCRQFAPGPWSRTNLSLIYRLPIKCIRGEMWLARFCSSPLALSRVPQGSILGPNLFSVLFADKVTLTTNLCHQGMWAESSASEYIRGVEEWPEAAKTLPHVSSAVVISMQNLNTSEKSLFYKKIPFLHYR